MADPVIVTGSDSGIGRAVAIALAHAGHDVGITWRTDITGAAETANAVREAGVRAAVRRLDVSDRPGEQLDELATELGDLWGIVTCAGAGHRAGVLDDTPERWRHALEVNLTSPILCAQAAARRLVARDNGGRIVAVTCVHEHVPMRLGAAYSAAKAGLGMAIKVMALELAPFDITVNAVAPGLVGPGERAASSPPIPLGRAGRANEIAATIAHLVSRDASYVTGSSFVVDGGLSLTVATPIALTAWRGRAGD